MSAPDLTPAERIKVEAFGLDTWDGQGHKPAGLTLNDDQVLLLARILQQHSLPADVLPASLILADVVYKAAEEILYADRMSRR